MKNHFEFEWKFIWIKNALKKPLRMLSTFNCFQKKIAKRIKLWIQRVAQRLVSKPSRKCVYHVCDRWQRAIVTIKTNDEDEGDDDDVDDWTRPTVFAHRIHSHRHTHSEATHSWTMNTTFEIANHQSVTCKGNGQCSSLAGDTHYVI